MSEPLRYQEAAALLQARLLLGRIADHRQTKRVPGPIRAEARALLRTLPTRERLWALVPDPLSARCGADQKPA